MTPKQILLAPLGMALVAAEAFALVLLACFLTGYTPAPPTLQIILAVTSFAVYYYHSEIKQDSIF
jgi:hypothetical protein